MRDFLRKAPVESALPSLPNAGARGGRWRCWPPGMFEYNFGDSEFLMLFLLLVTLPYAADRTPSTDAPRSVARRKPPDDAALSPALLDRIAGRSVLVVGDLMLDHFVIGRVDRISPEAPVPVCPVRARAFRLGGAANVAHNIAALGGRASRRRGRRATPKADG